MLFRPEEVHAASTPGPIFRGTADFAATISDHRFGVGSQNVTVLYLNGHRVAAIETGGGNVDDFAREKPADCQRFKASLGKPFLFPVDADTVLRRQVVKRGKGDNVVGIRMHPGGDARVDQIVQLLFAFLHG